MLVKEEPNINSSPGESRGSLVTGVSSPGITESAALSESTGCIPDVGLGGHPHIPCSEQP